MDNAITLKSTAILKIIQSKLKVNDKLERSDIYLVNRIPVRLGLEYHYEDDRPEEQEYTLCIEDNEDQIEFNRNDLKDLKIKDTQIRKLSFRDVEIETLVIEGLDCELLEFNDNCIINELNIEGGNIDKILFTNNCIIKTFNLQSTVKFLLDIKNCNIAIFNSEANIRKFSITNLDCDQFIFHNPFKMNYFNISNKFNVTDSFTLQLSFINFINISGDMQGKFDIIFDQCRYLSLSDINLSNELSITCIDYLHDFEVSMFGCHRGKLSFHDFKSSKGEDSSKIFFDKISFGQSEFKDCNFTTYKKFFIGKVQFQESTSYDCEWPKEVKHISETKSALASYYHKVRKMLEVDGDIFEAKNFNRLELIERANNTSRKHFADWFSLQLGEFTSKHGTSWPRAVLMLFLFNLFTFVFINFMNLFDFSMFKWLIHYISDDVHNQDMFVWYGFGIFNDETTHLSVKDVIYFMNPVHKIDNFQFRGNVWFYLYDTIGRAINGFIYFQIVRSFRKYK